MVKSKYNKINYWHFKLLDLIIKSLQNKSNGFYFELVNQNQLLDWVRNRKFIEKLDFITIEIIDKIVYVYIKCKILDIESGLCHICELYI